MDRALLKSNAKQQLGGSLFNEKWMLALVCCAIMTIIISGVSGVGGMFGVFDLDRTLSLFEDQSYGGVFSGVMNPLIFIGTGISSVAVLLISGPLSYGLAKVFLRLVYGEDRVNIAYMFDGFREDFGGNIVLTIMIGIFTFLWSLLFVIPGIIKAFSYSMAYYIKADHPDYDWRRCISESKELMRGYKGAYFVLQLSFIGWYFVCLFTFGLGYLWLLPYQNCTNANFYAWVTAQKSAGYEE